MTVNGEAVRFQLSGDTPLLWALRDAANLTGTKHGCEQGDCGACMVMVDGQSLRSCRVAISTLEGAEIVTIEGLSPGRSHPVQQAWLTEQVGQCGYCEPGMVIALAALMKTNPKPGESELSAISNICRCGIGPRALKAIRRASEAMGGASEIADVAEKAPVASLSSRFSNGSSASEQSGEQ